MVWHSQPRFGLETQDCRVELKELLWSKQHMTEATLRSSCVWHITAHVTAPQQLEDLHLDLRKCFRKREENSKITLNLHSSDSCRRKLAIKCPQLPKTTLNFNPHPPSNTLYVSRQHRNRPGQENKARASWRANWLEACVWIYFDIGAASQRKCLTTSRLLLPVWVFLVSLPREETTTPDTALPLMFALKLYYKFLTHHIFVD